MKKLVVLALLSLLLIGSMYAQTMIIQGYIRAFYFLGPFYNVDDLVREIPQVTLLDQYDVEIERDHPADWQTTSDHSGYYALSIKTEFTRSSFEPLCRGGLTPFLLSRGE